MTRTLSGRERSFFSPLPCGVFAARGEYLLPPVVNLIPAPELAGSALLETRCQLAVEILAIRHPIGFLHRDCPVGACERPGARRNQSDARRSLLGLLELKPMAVIVLDKRHPPVTLGDS